MLPFFKLEVVFDYNYLGTCIKLTNQLSIMGYYTVWLPHCFLFCFVLFCFLEFGGFGSVSGKIEIEIKINHEGEVNR